MHIQTEKRTLSIVLDLASSNQLYWSPLKRQEDQ